MAAVAVPSFKKYSAKAKSSEAALNLSALYLGEKSIQGQISTYVACVKLLGLTRAPKAYYGTGFDRSTNVGKDLAPANCADSTLGPPPLLPGLADQKTDWINTAAPVVFNDDDSYVIPSVMKVMGSVDMSVAFPAALAFPNSVLDPTPESSVASLEYKAATAGSISADSTVLSIWTIDEKKNIVTVSLGY